MTVDELQILITADARGIENVLKKTIDTVIGTVNKINSQEVDWTSIFTRSVSPAIIAGVASTLAYAISNAINFQAALATAGTAAGASSAQIAQVGQAALQTSSQVPASAQDIANAMLQLSSIFSNTNDQQSIAQAMAELSASGFGDLNDIVKASIDIFKHWGVTTQSDAIAVLTDLMHGAETAKLSIPALAGEFDKFSGSLVSAGAGLPNFNDLLATFASEAKEIGESGASQIFSALTTSADSATGPMELLGQSFDDVKKSILGPDGGLDAISKLSEKVSTLAGTATGNLVLQSLGLSSDQIGALDENAKKLQQLKQDQTATASSGQTIGQAYIQSDNSLRQLQTDWNKFKEDLIPIGDILVKGLDGTLKIFQDSLKGYQMAWNDFMNTTFGKGLSGAVGSAFKEITQIIPDTAQITNFLRNAQSKISPNLSNFSNAQIGAIETTATTNNLIPQLLDALQKGISGNNTSYNNIKQTFNLQGMNGSDFTSAGFAKMLYNAYQGYGQ